MNQDLSSQSAEAGAASTVAAGGSRPVQTRLWLRVLSLIVAAVALGFVVLFVRDQVRINQGLRGIRPFKVHLQRYLDQNGTLPSIFPEYADAEEVQPGRGRFTYVDKDVVAWARQANEAVLIGYGPVTRLFLRNDGHPAIFYNKGELRKGWVVEDELTPLVAEQSSSAPDSGP